MTTPSLAQTLDKALKYAVEEKNLELVQAILTKSTPANLTECLNLAMEHKCSEIVSLLLQKTEPLIPVHVPVPVSASLQKIESASILVSTPIPVPRSWVISNKPICMDGIYMKQNSPLMITLSDHNGGGAKIVLGDLFSGIISLEELNHQNDGGWTILHYLVRYHFPLRFQILNKVLDLGADVNLKNGAGCTPLMTVAAVIGDLSDDVMALLLEHPKIDLNVQSVYGNTALMIAASNKNISKIEMLMNHPNINPDLKDREGLSFPQIVMKICDKNICFRILYLYYGYHKVKTPLTISAGSLRSMPSDLLKKILDY